MAIILVLAGTHRYGFCWNKVLLLACHCSQQLLYSDCNYCIWIREFNLYLWYRLWYPLQNHDKGWTKYITLSKNAPCWMDHCYSSVWSWNMPGI